MRTATLAGIRAVPVDVQLDIGNGLPVFTIVGLGDTAVLEARERVRSAIRAQGYRFPNARVIVNLAPAPLRKHGTGFDLPIAAAVLAATGQIDREVLAGCLVVGELSLDGKVASVPGMLAHALGAREAGLTLLGPATARDACGCLEGLRFRPVNVLRDLVQGAAGEESYSVTLKHSRPVGGPDLADVAGHDIAKRSLEIAAVGGHNLMFVGPPGSGKTMLARRLAGLLPPLGESERLEAALIHSVAGHDERTVLAGVRPFRAPHHSVSVAGLVGGGTPPRPGEVSLAHGGVLFLDETPQYGPGALQALRQPLEDGIVTLVRAEGRTTYPSRFALVAAANPCPCGYFGDPQHLCTCAQREVQRYLGRIGGPLLDRIDLHLRVERIDPGTILSGPQGESSETVSERVRMARELALDDGRTDTSTLHGSMLLAACRLTPAASERLTLVARSMHLSGRSVTRMLRVARTVADLAGLRRVDVEHINESLGYRQLGGC